MTRRVKTARPHGRGRAAVTVGALFAPVAPVAAAFAALVGAGEGAIEVAGAIAPVVVALEQGAAALLAAPLVRRFLGTLVERHLVVDALDPRAGHRMVHPAGARIRFGEDDAVAAHLVDNADMAAVRSDHLHMLGDPAERLALVLPLRAPAAEIGLELRLVLAAIFVIVAVEILDLAPPPFRIMRVVLAAARTALLAHDRGVARPAARAVALRPVIAAEAAGDRRRHRMGS